MNHFNESEIRDMKEDIYSYISDASKDCYGHRYRFDVNDFSVVQLMMQADKWNEMVGIVIKEEEAMQAQDIAEFEQHVNMLIEMGAGTRERALDWIRDAEFEDDFDRSMGDDYLEYKLGLPYGYLAQTTQKVAA